MFLNRDDEVPKDGDCLKNLDAYACSALIGNRLALAGRLPKKNDFSHSLSVWERASAKFQFAKTEFQKNAPSRT